MIARDEEGFLTECLNSVRDVVDEIIVVDTGSTDSTPRIATDFGARVIPFEWNDDFSEARNVALEHASGDWILVFDADELISGRDTDKIRALANGDVDGYVFTYRSYTQSSDDIRWIANDGSYPEGNGWDGWISGRVVRMFRRDPRIRFMGAVHESVDPTIAAFGGTFAETDIIIHHYHEKKGKDVLRKKQLSYMRLCEKNLEKYPTNAKTFFDMGLVSRHILGDMVGAIAHQKQAIELDPGYEEARIELALSYYLGNAIKDAARELTTLLEQNPKCAPALLLCGIMLERQGKYERAIECYERAVAANPNLVDARVNLGTLFLRKGEDKRARAEWRRVYSLNPSNSRVLHNLGALELRDGNHDAARNLLEKALEFSPDNPALWNNMGVLCAATGRKQEAVKAFEKASELDPACEDARRNREALQTGARLASE